MIIIKKDGSVGSNFLRLLDWLWYSKYSRDEIFIDWNENGNDLLSPVFRYKNPEKQKDFRFYDHFVGKYNGLDKDAIDKRREDIPFYDKYNMPCLGVKNGYFYSTPEVYFERDFFLLRNTFNNVFNHRFSPTERLKESLFVNAPKTLGIHVRFPGAYRLEVHNGRSAQLEIQTFFNDCAKFVYEKFNNEKFEKVYVACDVEDFYVILHKYLREDQIIKISYNRVRGNNGEDWPGRKVSGIDIVYNSFLDIFNLSRCNKLLCGSSNFALTSLIVNPNLEFEFFPSLRSFHTG